MPYIYKCLIPWDYTVPDNLKSCSDKVKGWQRTDKYVKAIITSDLLTDSEIECIESYSNEKVELVESI